MAHQRISRLARLGVASGALATLLLAGALPVAAHQPHEAANAHQGEGQVIANGQNHPVFKNLDAVPGTETSCESHGPLLSLGETEIGPSWYGIETAHHGPDSGDPGKAAKVGREFRAPPSDWCYVADVSPSADNANPAIR